MKWLRDRTGRFTEYPHWDPEELDSECERVVRAFLTSKYGRATYPISTDDLTVLIEEHAKSLDQFAELPDGVEGRTQFYVAGRPDVAVSRLLQEAGRENRLRTTLTHELGHVKLHGFLWEFATPGDSRAAACNRDTIIDSALGDWMEWQAGYASGAYLIPRTVAVRLFGEPNDRWLPPESPEGAAMVERATAEFGVSEVAARVRLSQMKYLLPTSRS